MADWFSKIKALEAEAEQLKDAWYLKVLLALGFDVKDSNYVGILSQSFGSWILRDLMDNTPRTKMLFDFDRDTFTVQIAVQSNYPKDVTGALGFDVKEKGKLKLSIKSDEEIASAKEVYNGLLQKYVTDIGIKID